MFVVVLRDETGTISFIDRVFPDEPSAFEFVKVCHIPDGNYLIVTQDEWEQYQLTQALTEQQQYVEQIQQQEAPRPKPQMVTQYRPVTNFRPAFIGSSMKKKR